MSAKKNRIARVIDCNPTDANDFGIIAMIGDQLVLIPSELPLLPGDVLLVTCDDPPLSLEKIGSSAEGGWLPDGDGLRWRKPNNRGQTRFDALWKRHAIRRTLRDYFDGEGFIEIDTPLLVHGTTPDANIQSFPLEDRYLVTSSEYQIKRLEVAGFDRIYTLTQNFRRSDGDGPYHNQEFTMLEWARVGESLKVIEADVEQLIWKAHISIGGRGALNFNGHKIDITPPFERLSVAEVIGGLSGPLKDFSASELRGAVKAAGIELLSQWQDDSNFMFSLLMDTVQPKLGLKKPVFLFDWPAFQTSSVQEKERSGIAERSELFIGGIELSDGFPSLTSYERQIENFKYQNERRRNDNGPVVLPDVKYLEALRAGLPKGAGMALGFDRLVMVLTDRANIQDVLAFSWEEL